ncbi:MAG: hypothetical protein GYB67_16795, partial [Chloroflexi bacterium]|nr:hypothetical protein [Chloroflexota bacterium]
MQTRPLILRFSIRRHSIQLAVVAACGAAITLLFHYGFAARYSLAEFGDRHRQSFGTLTRYSNEGAYWFIGAIFALFVCYALGYWLGVKPSPHFTPLLRRWALALIVIGGVMFNLVLLPMYPADASDVYDYIMRGRMQALYGLNPMEDVPQQVAGDPFYRFVSWRRTPSAYGPAWEILAHVTTTFTADTSRNTQVIAYKLLAVAGYGVTALFIALTLRQIAPRRLLVGTYLFMWNPLVIYMTAGGGHNDTVMTACMAFAVYALSRRWYVASTLGAVLGVLVKFIPALLLPIIALVALRDLGVRRWLRYALVSALIGGAVAVVMYLPYWHGIDTLRTERRAFMYTGSVATVARHWLMPILDGVTDLSTSARETPNSRALLANGTLVIFGLYYLSQLIMLLLANQALTLNPA